MNAGMHEARIVAEHFDMVVHRPLGRRDQTRTTSLTTIVNCALSGYSVAELQAMARNYARDLGGDAIPMSAKRFYQSADLMAQFHPKNYDPPREGVPLERNYSPAMRSDEPLATEEDRRKALAEYWRRHGKAVD